MRAALQIASKCTPGTAGTFAEQLILHFARDRNSFSSRWCCFWSSMNLLMESVIKLNDSPSTPSYRGFRPLRVGKIAGLETKQRRL